MTNQRANRPLFSAPPFPLTPLVDGHGRDVRYIRLSVTDRCNLRCTYCRSGMETFIPHESVLRYEEMEQLVDMAVAQGVEKVRLTGGEPFARKGFVPFLERLRLAHPDLDIRITTNGTLLLPHIRALKALRLNAVNLSLDTFNRSTFERITGRDLLLKVLESMESLLVEGIPLKINAVAMRGINEAELPDFLAFAMTHAVEVRFIEFMPMGEGTRWTEALFWSASDLLDAARKLVSVTPVTLDETGAHRNSGPARLYDLAPLAAANTPEQLHQQQEQQGQQEPRGRLGLITPLSSHFCATCNRLRITSDGALRTCLFADREYRLRNVLRHPKLGIAAVRRIIALATLDKPVGARLLEQRNQAVAQRRMTAIGG